MINIVILYFSLNFGVLKPINFFLQNRVVKFFQEATFSANRPKAGLRKIWILVLKAKNAF